MKKWILLLIPIFVYAGITKAIPNPSAVYCKSQGYEYEIRTDEDGNQYGVCVFPDGSECSAWHYYCKCEPDGIGCWPGDFSCHWPCKEMRCKEAGEAVLISRCCEGLDEIYPADIFDTNCNILEIIGWWFLCSDCGNGICEDWESRCNCPADCAQPRIITVDDDGPADFNNIQAAIDDANEGDTIIVADGVYTGEGNRDIDFLGKAITLRSEKGPQNCIIDCLGSEDELHRGFYFHSGEDANSVLDGFTITNGYADPGGGGGINCFQSSPMISNCVIYGNMAPVRFFPGPFYGSFVFNNGGGIQFSRSSPIITNCYIVGNRVEGNGGGIHLYRSSPLICNCVIAGNIALHKGFGLGGAIHSNRSSPTIINCTVIENVAEERGGGIYCVYGGGGPIINSIFCRNIPDQIDTFLAGPVVTYSNVQGNWAGEGNIDVDPCFADVGYWDPNENLADPNDDFWIEGDYHLLPESACIDAGDPNYIAEPNATDLDGRPRVIGGRIDMGAYETPLPAVVRFMPNALSLTSQGKWITAFLWPPKGYNITDIEPNSIYLEKAIAPQQFWLSEKQEVVMARFIREEIQGILSVGEVKLNISGRLMDGMLFEGTDVIKVMYKGEGKPDKHVQASDPNPADRTTGISINADLSWTADIHVISHDVYFGASYPPPFRCNQTATIFDPGIMAYETTYYWRIDEINKWGTTSGEIWSFTTVPSPSIPPPPP